MQVIIVIQYSRTNRLIINFIKMKEKDRLHQRFNRANLTRQQNLNNQTRAFEEMAMFMYHKIHSEFQTFTLSSLCGGHRTKFMVDTSFQKAFSHFSLAEKVELYEKTIQLALQIQNSDQQPEWSSEKKYFLEQSQKSRLKEPERIVLQIQKGFRSWNQIEFIIDGFKVISNELKIDIRNYLLRRSKKKDRQCYVLEAIHFTDPDLIRFCFLTQIDKISYLPLIIDLTNQGYAQTIRRMCSKKCKIGSKENNTRRNSQYQTEELVQQPDQNNQFAVKKLKDKEIGVLGRANVAKSQNPQQLVVEILKPPEEQNLHHELSDIIASENQKYQSYQNLFGYKNKEILHKNVFSVMFPNYDLSQLENLKKFKVYANSEEQLKQQNGYVYQNIQNPNIFRFQVQFNNIQSILLFQILNDLPLYKYWHFQVDEGQIKLGIYSQNSAICYQKHKAYSQWYNQRDFLFFRHAFKVDKNYFMVDKWIQNTNFIPLNPIVRGKIERQIMMISPKPKGSKLTIQCYFDHCGLLSQSHKNQLTKRYLLGFSKIQQCFFQEQPKIKIKIYFKHQWKVQGTDSIIKMEDKSQYTSIHDSQFEQQLVSCIEENDESETFYSIQEQLQQSQNHKDNESVHQVVPEQIEVRRSSLLPRRSLMIQNFQAIIVQTNQEGLVKLPQMYLKVKHPNNIIQASEKLKIRHNFDDFLLKDVWQYLQEGGLKLINKKLIQAQDSVFSFILSTLKKNIFSGKGALNISLPVTIFNTDSNLSRLCVSLASAPQFLETAAYSKDLVQRFKLSMIFGLTNSLLFLDVEKPFNPILGETYQCFIAGCPVYAEQISHHPPISALLMYGRGYKVHACLQGMVNIHMNVAEGINQGLYHILFDDGQQICFQTPPAQFTGFAFGQRKFRFIKKGYYFDSKNNLFSQLMFQDTSGFFCSNKWKYKDQVFAELFSVKPQFLKKFTAQFPQKKLKPQKKDILDKFGQLTGRWTHQICWDKKKMYSFNENLPYVINQYPYPLNSNSKYRQDIYYREHNDLARSQIQKQRMENIQRQDKKKREKYSCKRR